MKISISTNVYNDRRYGRPWIARVDFASTIKGEFIWGEWCGSAGSSGVLEVDAEAGDIVARGQRDTRKPRYSAPDYYVVEADGTLRALTDKAAALRLWREKVSVGSAG